MTRSKPTQKDVAAAAGVGSATVQRVLSGRGGVSEEVMERVVRTARKLGYGRRMPETHHGIFRIEVLMVRPDTEFFSRLNEAFERVAETLDKSIILHRTFISDSDPVGAAKRISGPSFRRAGLIVVFPNDPVVVAAVRAAACQGLPIVQVVSQTFGPDIPYVGIDNYAAGRTAAYLMTRMLRAQAGSIVAICHSAIYPVHRDRLRGFSDALQDHGAAGLFRAILFGRDDERTTAEVLRQALQDWPDVIGVYNAGGATTGTAQGLSGKSEVVWVGHELTSISREYLRAGRMSVVLDQAPEMQARMSVDIVLSRLGLVAGLAEPKPIPFLIVTPENLG